MSLIIHRCVVCAHPDHWHDDTTDRCCWGHCQTGRHWLSPGPSEVLTTYTPHGDTVTRMEPPGSAFPGFGRGVVRLCGCTRCHALYASLTGDAA